ncbi:MAG: hypothetical protein AAF967_09390 [Pseudomonadota bacterium]
MLFEDPVSTWLYVLPFLIALPMPGWRTLVALGIAFAGLVLWALANPGDGAGAALGVAFLLFVAMGTFAGVVTRALTLAMAPIRQRPLLFSLISLIGFLIPPVLIAGPEVALRWFQQPSMRACDDITFRVRIADQVLNVPMAPIFAVNAPVGQHPGDRGGRLTLNRNTAGRHSRYLSEVCRRTMNDNEVFAPAALIVSTSPAHSSLGRDWLKPRCAAPSTPGMRQTCEIAALPVGRPRIGRAVFYGPDSREDADRWLDTNGKSLAQWVRSKRPTYKNRGVGEAKFEEIGDGVRISTARDLMGPSGEPFTVRCTGNTVTRCAAAGTLSNGIQVVFTFLPIPGHEELDARKFYKNLDDLILALSAEPQQKSN